MEDEPGLDWKKPLIFGCLFIPLLISFTCLSILAITYRQQIPYVQNYFPTKTAPPPSILVNQPDKDAKITSDDFSTNQNNWSTRFALSKAEVKDGKLFFEAFKGNTYSMAYCNSCWFVVKSNQTLTNPYYLQADFNTDKKTDGRYGLVYNISNTLSSYYIFVINPTSGIYSVYKLDDDWRELSSGPSDLIKPSPEINTLSLEFNAGAIRFYINGQTLTSVTDPHPLKDGKIGVYVEGTGFKLIVDNLFAYHK